MGAGRQDVGLFPLFLMGGAMAAAGLFGVWTIYEIIVAVFYGS